MSTGSQAELAPRGPEEWEWDEGLFVRDLDGHLIRYDKATREELKKTVKLEIDGQEVEVYKAVPATDDLGNLKYDQHGEIIPRPTTIYDAVTRRYEKRDHSGGLAGRRSDVDVAAESSFEQIARQGKNPIPVLCHTPYMDPVAVCRVCVVQLARLKRSTGKIEVDPKLLPACQHRVEAEMVVNTIASPDPGPRQRVESAVKTLVELLMADHPSPCAKEQQPGAVCELETLARQLEVTAPRFEKRAVELPKDDSSVVIAVDHNACILCDRCVRGCDVIKENHVIGRMGKGYKARIAFDLDVLMGNSSCVACGECGVSCPTGALTLKGISAAAPGGPPSSAGGRPRAKPAADQFKLEGDPVTIEDLINHQREEISEAFRGLARPFLQWNLDAIVRRRFKPGEVICREGEFGRTAFLIESGSVEVCIKSELGHVKNETKRGFLGGIGKFAVGLLSRNNDDRRDDEQNDVEDRRPFIPIDAPVALPYGKPVAPMGPGDIFGEMTCMNHYPRSATVVAVEECSVLEMLRNVLYIMQRNPFFRRELGEKYRDRAVDNFLRNAPLFAQMRSSEHESNELVGRLRKKVSLRRCEPGEVILRQGARATDGVYLVRTGFVKVSQARPGGERVLNYVGPGGVIGEIGVLSDFPELRDLAPAGIRTATCTALDHVDLIRIDPDDFRAILSEFPAVRPAVIEEARRRLQFNSELLRDVQETPLADFLGQGLMNAKKLLVLDLEKCTRCDECTKACADTHHGVTRLIREGLRFDKFLVASSCRSCLDPYCLVGCPVGSISRSPKGEISIADWCIGCGLCAENCPYGNINMVDEYDTKKKAQVRKATTCDLCQSLGDNHEPSCVYACPHDAAHRMSGPDLLSLVREAGRTS
jgi:CRP-like cAMP-binding protein/Fe-S-cluster-containing hydrogenase component 2